MLKLEYDDTRTSIPLGQLLLHDDTLRGVRHRLPVAFYVSGKLYINEGNFHKHCNPDAIKLLYHEASCNLRDGLNIPDVDMEKERIQLGDLSVELSLDMSCVEPVYAETEFVLEITVKLIQADSSKEESLQTIERVFFIHENRQACLLHLSYKDERSPLSPVQRWPWVESDNPDDSIDLSRFSVLREEDDDGEAEDALLSLYFRNTASIKNDEESCTNYLEIEEISVNSDDDALNVSELLFFDIDGESIPARPWREKKQLLPSREKDDILTFILSVNCKADSSHFTGEGSEVFRDYNIMLNIKYSLPGNNGERISESCAIPIQFTLQEDFGNDVVAVDYGTSAISIARNADDQVELLPLQKIWEEPRKEDGYSMESIEQGSTIIASLILYSKGKDSIVVSPSIYECENILAGQYQIPFLKSHIGGCKKDIVLDPLKSGKINKEDNTYPTKSLLLKVYKQLYDDYMQYKRSNGTDFRRMVITHPNSYMDGQIEFLKEAIAEALPLVRDIQVMSESDAVIYSYLRNEELVMMKDAFCRRMDTHVSATDRELFEHILCFDIGAGTVDLSYRKIRYIVQEEKNGEMTLFPDLDAGAGHELLGMLSVNGAGNALDEILAFIIDDFCQKLERDIIPKMDGVAEDTFGFIPLMSHDEGNVMQEQLLLDFKRNIGEGKRNVNSDSTHMKIKVGISDDDAQEQTEIINASDLGDIAKLIAALIDKDGDDANVSLLLEDDICYFSISMAYIQERLQRNYYPSQINDPIRATLASADKVKVDTVLISGRGALFPGVKAQIEAEINRYCIHEPVPISMDTVDKMKSVVVDGALRWGIDNSRSKVLFSPPRLFGVLGAAWQLKGEWHWETLIQADNIQRNRSERMSEPFEMNPKTYQQFLILHSSILNDEIIGEQLISLLNSVEPKDIQRTLEHSGYFRVLSVFSMSKFRNQGSRVPVTIEPILPEEKGYGEKSDYPNIRVKVKVGSKTPSKKSVSMHQVMTFHQFWPNNIFNHSGEE